MEQLSANLIMQYSGIFKKEIYYGAFKDKQRKASKETEIS